MGALKDILVNIGAIAGFAAVVGLAVLAMLYFSQARDVRRLREWAGREPERATEVELRAQQIASQAIAQAYQSMQLRQSEADAAAGIAEEQGVDVSTPLVAESTSDQQAVAAEARAELAEGGASDGAAHEGAADELPPTEQHDVVSQEFAGDQASDHETGHEADPEEPAEHNVAAAANTSAGSDTIVHPGPLEPEPIEPEEARPNRLTPSTPAAARAAAPLPPLPPLDTSEFSAVGSGVPATPPIPDYYLNTETTGSGHFDPVEPDYNKRSRVPFAVAGVLVAVFAVILIATQIGGNDTDKKTPAAKTAAQKRDSAASGGTGKRNPEINRPAVTISVLNGTPTSGLAKLGGDALIKAGFTDTTTGNYNGAGTQTTSTVYYAAGSKLEAQEVAKELAIKDVKEASEAVLAAGGSVPVIVVLGADFENQ